MILHLETATKVCSVALSNEGRKVAMLEQNDENYSHSEKLTVFIEQLLKENEVAFSELKAISVASGPGSYTGLRIGVSTAKGLCYGLEIPLIAVNALESIAQQIQVKYPTKKHFAPLIDARRMEVFCAIYDQQFNVVKPISADILTAASYSEWEDVVFAGDGAKKAKEIWNNRSEVVDDQLLSSAEGQIQLAWEKFQHKNFEDLAYFEPFYLKDFK